MIEAYIGCDEWQDFQKFETIEEALAWIDDWKRRGFSMGLYPATECFIRGPGLYQAWAWIVSSFDVTQENE